MKKLKSAMELLGLIIKLCLDALALFSAAKNALTHRQKRAHQIADPGQEGKRRCAKNKACLPSDSGKKRS